MTNEGVPPALSAQKQAIAGYCAYFVDLAPKQQEELIARTEEQMN